MKLNNLDSYIKKLKKINEEYGKLRDSIDIYFKKENIKANNLSTHKSSNKNN